MTPCSKTLRLTGLDSADNLRVIRQSARAALELFAADGRQGDEWRLQPWPPSLTEPERNEVALGCYEMLMVLADAVSQPLPGESPIRQARKRFGSWTEPPSCATSPRKPITCGAPPAWNQPVMPRGPRGRSPRPTGSSRMGLSIIF